MSRSIKPNRYGSHHNTSRKAQRWFAVSANRIFRRTSRQEAHSATRGAVQEPKFKRSRIEVIDPWTWD